MSSPTHEPCQRKRCDKSSANNEKKQELLPKCRKIKHDVYVHLYTNYEEW